ncbi:MAG TPA: hypothetical protein VGO58_07055 [Chitinophagaceae bacterium]|jgi:hypothetical protein|nr:hypothetical protein [Chitinophagaceae bacterium]
MTKYAVFIFILAFRILYHPLSAKSDIPPFASPLPVSHSTSATPPAKVISFDGSITSNKVILNWVVGENETADQFEVEKSTDGKNFTMAALVFGTDKPATDKYQFYEKAGNQRTLYRIKLINKNHQSEYSAVVEINPNV